MATPKEKAGKAMFAMFRPGKYMQSKADEKQAAAELENANRMREEAFGIANQLNWEPDYVSDLVKPYQKAQSPLARSFLESLLTGANPSMVQSTRLGAPRLQAGAQSRFDEQTGGFDSLLARQREIEKQTPWAPGTYGHAPAVYKLPEPEPPPPPAASKPIDKSGSTPESMGQVMDAWGITPEFEAQVHSAAEAAGTNRVTEQAGEAWYPDEYLERLKAAGINVNPRTGKAF